MPIGFARFSGGFQSAILHGLCGNHDHDTNDFSTNSQWINWITLGEGLHNNHHMYPNRYKFGKYDFTGFIIKCIIFT